MTPEEKIEALREWVQRHRDNYRASEWGDGFTAAVQEIRDIIDPPAPQWRKRVDALHPKGVTGTQFGVNGGDAGLHAPDLVRLALHLGAALYHLSHVANPGHYDVAEELANVVVVAEVAVGNGWRADPDDLRRGLFESSETTGVMFIAEALTNFYEPSNWRVAGNRAAAWLRHILDGGAE